MEACGIDVFAMVRANGLVINVVRDRSETPHYFGLLLAGAGAVVVAVREHRSRRPPRSSALGG
ncbi:MAG: hypothetical protein FJ125_02680 [Deltaproteobacteria bacterium]|nr:hypothetical protein [Deltaproteobacteria bacterium]